MPGDGCRLPGEYADIELEELEPEHEAEVDTPTDETDEGPLQSAAPTAAAPDSQAEHGTNGPPLPGLFDPPAAPAARHLQPPLC
ncbi:hypothetical protein [Streptomyces sp. NPDC054797]